MNITGKITVFLHFPDGTNRETRNTRNSWPSGYQRGTGIVFLFSFSLSSYLDFPLRANDRKVVLKLGIENYTLMIESLGTKAIFVGVTRSKVNYFTFLLHVKITQLLQSHLPNIKHLSTIQVLKT